MSTAPAAATMALRRGATPNLVEIYGIGWAARIAKIGLFAWIAIFVIACVVTLATVSGDRYEKKTWILGIGVVTFLPFALLAFAGRNIRARRPFLTLTRQGATTSHSGLIRWDAIRHIRVSESSIEKNLYIELRDSLHAEQTMGRLLPLREATEHAKFRLVVSGDVERTIVRAELHPELQELFRAYTASGGLDSGEAAATSAAFAIPAKQEIVIPQAYSDRWATGIVGALTAAGAVAIAALLGWVLFSAKEDDPLAYESLLAMSAVALLALACFRGAMRLIAESRAGEPLLVVDRIGLTHLRYGLVPWSEITGIQVDNFAGNVSRSRPFKPVACAYLSESYYHQRLKGRRFERFALAFENTNWKLQWRPRLPLIRGLSPYLRNGLPMPLETVEELARLIREFPREGPGRPMSA